MKQVLLLKGQLCPKNRLFLEFILIPFLLVFSVCEAQEQKTLRGIVVSVTDNAPLNGATITLKDHDLSTLTDENGNFVLNVDADAGTLIVSYLGYETQVVEFTGTSEVLRISLELDEGMLDDVIVNTGYQELSKKHATGSFEVIDNELLNRSPSPNLLERLEGVTSGTLFSITGDKQYLQSDIQIRGRSTLFANSDPLIVIDNFPFDGELSDINPNDVESITILKDAAAASIWGVRAGNGVIVITTKKGRYNSKPEINVDAKFSVSGKPDIYYLPQLTSSEFIEVEKELFDLGNYNSVLNSGYRAVSPVVEALNRNREGKLNNESLNNYLQELENIDGRKNILKYFYRPKSTQQYQISVRGGSDIQKYFLSMNYSKTLPNEVTDLNQLITLRANNTYTFFDGKLDLDAGVNISKNISRVRGSHYDNVTYPYESIIDSQGNPLPVPRTLRLAYIDTAGGGKLLDWHYRPLEELYNQGVKNDRHRDRYRVNTSLRYRPITNVEVSAQYVYEKGVMDYKSNHSVQSYFTRNEINTLSQIDRITGEVIRPTPLGDILTMATEFAQTHNGRLQGTWNINFGDHHHFNILGGWEIKEYRFGRQSNRLYGYDPDIETHQNNSIDFSTRFPYYYSGSMRAVPPATSKESAIDRYYSYYANLNYSYNDIYTVTVSARKDASNLFGVKSNQKGISLWSAGLSWNLSNLSSYKIDWLPYLRLRATYGFNGNIDKSVSAYLTARTGRLSHDWDVHFLEVVNPPNPSLRWEKIKNINLGLDFTTTEHIITGSIEYWSKVGTDLIGTSAIASQTGATSLTGNTASNRNRGIEIHLTSRNINRALTWSTVYILNFTKEEVTEYYPANGSNYNVVSRNYRDPIEGYPFYSVFSLPWAGLNDEGAPQGYIADKISNDYRSILNSTDRSELKFHGPALPTIYGSVRNNLNYRGISLSFNIGFEVGHYFRKWSLNNGSLYAGDFQLHDYAKRWKKPGDEIKTDVPALIYPANFNRDNFYKSSSVLVEKADHIRLRDITVDIDVNQIVPNTFDIYNFHFFGSINHLGILWKATNTHYDPNAILGIPTPRSYTFGLRAKF